MSQSIGPNKVVHIHYTLTTEEEGEIDSSRGFEPLAYLHGAENIVPGLERQLAGKRVGDAFVATVPPGEGYGEREEEGLSVVPRDAFPEDAEIEPGVQILIEDDDGETTPVWIIDIEEGEVTLDKNHPLAGSTLQFDVEVVGIRDATQEELVHGHPHEPGDHHH